MFLEWKRIKVMPGRQTISQTNELLYHHFRSFHPPFCSISILFFLLEPSGWLWCRLLKVIEKLELSIGNDLPPRGRLVPSTKRNHMVLFGHMNLENVISKIYLYMIFHVKHWFMTFIQILRAHHKWGILGFFVQMTFIFRLVYFF